MQILQLLLPLKKARGAVDEDDDEEEEGAEAQLKQLLLNKLYLNGYEEVPHCRFG